MAIRGILFDKDGTLIDVHATWGRVYHDLLTELFPNEVEAKLALGGHDATTGQFRAGSPLAGGTTADIVRLWWPDLTPAETAEKIRVIEEDFMGLALRHVRPLFELAPILSDLRGQGFLLGVGTNDAFRSTVAQLQMLGIAPLFDVILGADSVARPKPSGQMVQVFARSLGIDPSEVAMVGDNSHDMEEARNGGAGLAIAVLSGNSAHEDIAHMADLTLASIVNVRNALKDRS